MRRFVCELVSCVHSALLLLLCLWRQIIKFVHFYLFDRYQLFLQVKQDVLQGRLPVAFELAAELGAFVVQCK